MRRGAKPEKSKLQTKLPIARKSRKSEGSRVHDLEKRLAEALQRETEALGQQTAASEILRVISSSPTDVQPVFDAIVLNASRLCGGEYAIVIRYDGEMMHLAAQHNPRPGAAEPVARLFPRAPARGSSPGRAILNRSLVHIPDVLEDPEYDPDVVRAAGLRGVLSMPMFRDGQVIGAISVSRNTPGPFAQSQIELLQTFADQAVIAIENVRLFTELKEKNSALTHAHAQVTDALEQQTATSEILRTIAHTQTDLQPVFDTIVRSAARLCHAPVAGAFLTEGRMVHHLANYGSSPEALAVTRLRYPRPVGMDSVPGMAILTRSVVHVPDIEEPSAGELVRQIGRALGFRSSVGVPMLREGEAVGAIIVNRREPGRFSDGEVELLKTFADQAVIAIENVRLFTELEARNRDLTATSEVLGVISSSPTNVHPVFDAIANSAVRLTGAVMATVYEFDGSLIHLRVLVPGDWPHADEFRLDFPRPPAPTFAAGHVILERAVFHRADLQNDPDTPEITRAWAVRMDTRSVLWVPMLQASKPIGVIGVVRRDPGLFPDEQVRLLQTFADQAVIAIENVRLFNELQDTNRDLTESNAQVTEALEQQTATAEILKIISTSPTDLQPVLDAVVNSAARFCGADNATVFQLDGETLRAVAHHGPIPVDVGLMVPCVRGSVSGRTVLERRPIHVTDLQAESADFPEGSAFARRFGHRTTLSVPLLREGTAIGAIQLRRPEANRFTNKQVALLQTFADQAVIAIENVRLFKELEARNRDLSEALEQQTATAQLLRVISSSPTDVQPVFDTIVRSALRLCNGATTAVFRVDGGMLHHPANYGGSPKALAAARARYPRPVGRDSIPGIAILTRSEYEVPDTEDPAALEMSRETGRILGIRSLFAVPMLRDGQAVGAIVVTRREPGRFAAPEVSLLQTFADQAVIAIENVRLFKELEEKNRALTESHAQVTEALEQQTATAEILRVISSSPTDVQPVFDTITQNALELCGAASSLLTTFDGELLHLAALANLRPGVADSLRRVDPMRPGRGAAGARAILTRAVVHIPDLREDPEYALRDLVQALDFRSVLAVPMLREGKPIGTINVHKGDPEPFSESQIALLQTFAAQAVIAIENARLFKELQARTGELTQSVEQLTALGEVSRAVSSTLDVETVLDTIVSRASQLAGAAGCSIYEYDEGAEQFELRATHNDDTEFVEALRAARLRKGEGLMGRAAEMREPIQIPDITQPGAYQSSVRDTLIRFGYRALLAVPLLREDQIIGSLSFNRKAPGAFPPEVVDVLKTFATQSALAIQNARLFREIADKSQQLEAASRHKSEFLANMSHELRTPLNAIIGFSEVLAQGMFGDINEKQTEYLHDILESGRHLLSLINDILDLSKIEAGRMELELTDFNVSQAIQNASILVRERAIRRGIALHEVIEEGVGDIRGDERKVKQVLLNLLSNAIKFTPEGGRIEVRAASTDGMVEVSVTDTGVGIAPADQEAVFEEFRQVGTADKKAEGTGLGLALAKKFIELHRGRIWVESELGRGSTFTFTLPVS
jgi:GAF domain-containing protein